MMLDIEDKIRHYREQFWQTGISDITDAEYDALLDLLKIQDPNNELVVGIESNPIIVNKVKHPSPMLSLDKAYSWDELVKWMNKVARTPNEYFTIQPKLDGQAGKYYVDTKIFASRGDGEFGENNSDKICNLVISSPNAEKFEDFKEDAIGEVVITFANFDIVNAKLEKPYKTPLSLVNGVMNSKDLLDIQLEFIDYTCFPTSLPLCDIREHMIEDIFTEFGPIYPMDGVVIKLSDSNYSKFLGSTEHHPKGQIAFKKKAELFKTKILNVILQHGKEKLTPVAILSPTEIGGVTVSRASLHNAKELLDNDIHINDTAYVMRAGGINPYIAVFEKNPIPEERITLNFNSCNFCGADLEYIEPELYCSNGICPGNVKTQLTNSAAILGIDNLGKSTIEKMVDDLGVNTIFDILVLEHDDISKLDGFKDKSTNKLYDNIQQVLTASEDYKIIAALNIPGIGEGILKQLLSKINIQQLLDISIIDLTNFTNFSEIRATSLVNGLAENAEVLDNLLEIVNIIETKVNTSNIEVVKQTICFSGTFDKPKQYYYTLAQQKGLTVVDQVTSKLDYLVSAGAISTKVEKARKNNYTKILSINEFLIK